jgi:hypothetical protein
MAVARPSGGMISRFIGIFVSPKKVFADVDAGAHWWEPWVLASVINMVIAYVAIPVQLQLFRLRSGDMPPEDFEKALQSMQSFPFKYIGIFVAPVAVFLVGAVFSAVSYIAVSVLSEKSSFRKHFTLYLWTAIIPTVGMLVSNLLVRMKGVEKIRSMPDAVAPFGPAAFVSESSKIVYAILSTLDVFTIWFYVLIALGVTQIFRVSWRSSLFVVIPIWLLSVLMALLGARFGGAA